MSVLARCPPEPLATYLFLVYLLALLVEILGPSDTEKKLCNPYHYSVTVCTAHGHIQLIS